MTKLAVFLLFVTSSPAVAVSLTEARDTYDRNKVADAEKLYAAILADPAATGDEKAGAGVELARIAWLIDGDADKALARLHAAQVTGGKPCEVGDMTTRVLRESHRDLDAIAAEPALLQACDKPARRDDIRVNVVGARLDRAVLAPAERRQRLDEAKAENRLFTQDAGVEAARIRLETALLTDDGPSALAAWKDYFWLDDGDAPQALQKVGATRTFTRGLAGNSTISERLALAELLMRAGFAEQSRRYADAHGLPGSASNNPVWRMLNAYWQERDRLLSELLRVNRELARDRKDETSLETAAKAMTASLMKAAGATGDPRAALLKYYGLVASVGKTSGYPSIHMGHVMEDHDETVTQYGHSAKIRFQAIDNMIANGVESWLWDGSAMVGGWTSNGVIVHVRPGYVQSPLRGYRLTQGGPDLKEVTDRQPKLAAEDIAALKQRAVASLEGLNDRLQLQYVDQILATARSRATSETDVRRLFLAEYSKANLNQSITVHEGRHAIDNAMGLGTTTKVDQAVLEYNAKLSELALTPYPRMALRNMDRNLEGDGPHDRGAARLFGEYKQWMQAHPDQIMGYDPKIPVLEQLDKLTDGQIRDIARSLDPLARGGATASGDTRSGTSTR